MAYNLKHFSMMPVPKRRWDFSIRIVAINVLNFFFLLLWDNVRYNTAQKLNMQKPSNDTPWSTISIWLGENIVKLCTIDTMCVCVHTHAAPLQLPHGILPLERYTCTLAHIPKVTPSHRRGTDTNGFKHAKILLFDLVVWLVSLSILHARQCSISRKSATKNIEHMLWK